MIDLSQLLTWTFALLSAIITSWKVVLPVIRWAKDVNLILLEIKRAVTPCQRCGSSLASWRGWDHDH